MQQAYEMMLRTQLNLPNDIELAAAELLLSDNNLSTVIFH